MNADQALEWVRKEICGLCEATEDDELLAKAFQDHEGKQGAHARGRIHEAKGIRRTMSDVIQMKRRELADTNPTPPTEPFTCTGCGRTVFALHNAKVTCPCGVTVSDAHASPPTEPALPTWEECVQASQNRTALQSLLCLFGPSISVFRERVSAALAEQRAQAEAPLRERVAKLEAAIRDEELQKIEGYRQRDELNTKLLNELTTARAEIAIAREGWQKAHTVVEEGNKLLHQMSAEIARLTHALAVPEVWSQEERDGMAAAFKRADGKHGHYETLFAVAAWLLHHRAAQAAPPTATGENGPVHQPGDNGDERPS